MMMMMMMMMMMIVAKGLGLTAIFYLPSRHNFSYLLMAYALLGLFIYLFIYFTFLNVSEKE